MDIHNKKLSEQWKLLSAEEAGATGDIISSREFQTHDWHTAYVPSTILAILWDNGLYKDLYTGTNMQKVDTKAFTRAWWYRKQFYLTPEEAASFVHILFDGINYRANIWLNGKQLGDKKLVVGAFRRFGFDITPYIHSGENILAVEVFPPQPGDFSTGFVDWNIDPPDRNMGIFREVILHFNQGVIIGNPFVAAHYDPAQPGSASLTVSADLGNITDRQISGVLTATIDSTEITQPVILKPGEQKTISLSPEAFDELDLKNPRLWWPNNMGEPNLYKAAISFSFDEAVSDKTEVVFGIRKVEDYITDDGHRGYIINGRKVLIKGAAWTDDLLLRDTPESLEAQVAYVRHLNLNCIRLEGIWGKDQTLYDLCDRYGILMMVGWSCHWEHEEYLGKPVDPLYGGITEPEEIELIAASWKDQLLWLRNHPSIFVWTMGSDMIPHPDLEKKYINIFRKYDPTRPYLNSTGGVGSDQGVITQVEVISEVSGSSGMKMLGPYAYTPPVYWYTDKKFGGAYGFNTETCPGANIPPLESIQQMIPAGNQWPVDKGWEYHCGKNNFNTLDRILTAVEKRYGAPENTEDLALKAQVLNYELMRPMFEAFRAHIPHTTGIIQWMLNSAWPRMYWQLYDYYLRPNGAFYATRKACNPLHLIYHYGEHAVRIVNEWGQNQPNLGTRIRILDTASRTILDKEINTGCNAGKVEHVFTIPEKSLPASMYFLDLRLTDPSGSEIDNNFYWLSGKPDVLDYDYPFDDWPFYTPSREYADYTDLQHLPQVSPEIHCHRHREENQTIVEVTLANPETNLAFFTELLIKGEESGLPVLPAQWDDNYVSLLPGENRDLRVILPSFTKTDNILLLEVNGWNVKKQIIQIR